jgi:hypothetical protein
LGDERTDKYIIRRYRDGDEVGINSIYQEEFGRHRDLKIWHWKHKENSAGMATVWVAERSDGEIIGNLSINRVRFQLGEKELMSGQAVDIMVKRKFRRLGKRRVVLDLCSEENHSVLWQQGFHFLFGFPIKFFFRLTTKLLGYSLVCDVPLMVKPLQFTPIIEGRFGGRHLVGLAKKMDRLFRKILLRRHERENPRVKIFQTDRFDKGVDEIWQHFASSYKPISVVRDSQYLNWRFADHPNIQYALYVAKRKTKVAGYIVMRVRQEGERRRGYITDILAHPDEEKWVIPQLLSTAIVFCLKEEAENVIGWALPHMSLFRKMKRRGFISRDGDIKLVTRDLSGKISPEFLFNSKNWYVSIGDSDGI